ncbi:hypothetical protein F5B20DRAFT_586768 [Whalleya microplaca]|nr:hypothetical protein F5B20DRAFT_586768 [Whalleya microplaca]
MADAIFTPADELPRISSTTTPRTIPGAHNPDRDLPSELVVAKAADFIRSPHDDGNLVSCFSHPAYAYEDLSNRSGVKATWVKHLTVHNYLPSFQALPGTEQGRYQLATTVMRQTESDRDMKAAGILQRFRRTLQLGRVYGLTALQKHTEAERRFRAANANANVLDLLRQRGRRLVGKIDEFERETKEAIHALKKHFASKGPSRLQRQDVEAHKSNFPTPCGQAAAVLVLQPDKWFMGHVPGDPIFRIVDAPNDMAWAMDDTDISPSFSIPDFDLDPEYWYRLRYEGIVPFSPQELSFRLRDSVYGPFLKMVIATLAFNPADPEADVPELLRECEAMIGERETTPPKEATYGSAYLQLLQKIWVVKYGPQPTARALPRFLQAQFRSCRFRIGELCWILYNMHPHHPIKNLYVNCEWLVKAMVGHDIRTMAQLYLAKKLFPEAKKQLEKGGMENVFFYRSDTTVRPVQSVVPTLADVYNHKCENQIWTLANLETLSDAAAEVYYTATSLLSDANNIPGVDTAPVPVAFALTEPGTATPAPVATTAAPVATTAAPVVTTPAPVTGSNPAAVGNSASSEGQAVQPTTVTAAPAPSPARSTIVVAAPTAARPPTVAAAPTPAQPTQKRKRVEEQSHQSGPGRPQPPQPTGANNGIAPPPQKRGRGRPPKNRQENNGPSDNTLPTPSITPPSSGFPPQYSAPRPQFSRYPPQVSAVPQQFSQPPPPTLAPHPQFSGAFQQHSAPPTPFLAPTPQFSRAPPQFSGPPPQFPGPPPQDFPYSSS